MNHKERLAELLRAITRNSGRSRVFEHFLIMQAAAISNRFSRGDFANERESRFLEIISKYKREDIKLFVDCAADLILALEDCIGQKCLRVNAPPFAEIGFDIQFPIAGTKPHFGDVLGDIFSETGLNEQSNGQVFTPKFAADLMANLAMNDEIIDGEIERNGFIGLVEPCCGSGVIIFEGLNRLLERGINPQRQSVVIASDTDERCVLMTYIQLSFYGIPAIVQQKDAITGAELSPPWLTPMFVHDKWAARVRNYEPPKILPPEPAGQLTLF